MARQRLSKRKCRSQKRSKETDIEDTERDRWRKEMRVTHDGVTKTETDWRGYIKMNRFILKRETDMDSGLYMMKRETDKDQ